MLVARQPDWAGQTVYCLASGPSLTVADCALVQRAGCRTVVANSTFRAAPWADVVYAFDSTWWTARNDKTGEEYWREVQRVFAGRKLSSSQVVSRYGVETTYGSRWFRDFHNSGGNSISLAVSAGAARVVLLGFDCQFAPDGRRHWHPDHPKGKSNCLSIPKWPAMFAKVAAYAKARGVEVVNASRATALTCFPRAELEDVLP